MQKRLRIVSYNIHKGFTAGNLQFVLRKIRESIRQVNADVVLLQEVLGHHEEHAAKVKDWPTTPQFEYLADQVWPHYAYGRNAVYTSGHHGNAILSKFPISFWENVDVSSSRLERRGLLHSVVEIPHHTPLHVICLHLGLFESDRISQLKSLAERIHAMVPDHTPLVVGGDFNDWRERATKILWKELKLKEVFTDHHGAHARTFPSWLPVLRLDRIYCRGIKCAAAKTLSGSVWSTLSDHTPLLAEFDLKDL